MREFQRPSVSLPTLCGTGKGAKQAAADLQMRLSDPKAKLKFPSHWNESDVRGALHAMQGFACAYCQRALDADQGTVDHFRPKDGDATGGYFWLAYEFSNLLLVCTWCSRFKGDRFPLMPGPDHVTYENRSDMGAEVRKLLDPTSDPVSQWFNLQWGNPEERCFIGFQPKLLPDSLEYKRAEYARETFRLNKDVELLQERIRAISAARPGFDARSRDLLRPLSCRYLRGGAFVFAFLQACRPELLPTPQEEIVVFLEELLEKLRLARCIQQAHPNEKVEMRRLEQICWAFAVLWASPPRDTLSSDEIAAWLHARNLKPLVQPFYQKLAAP